MKVKIRKYHATLIPDNKEESTWLLNILREKLTTETKPAPMIVPSLIGDKNDKLKIGQQSHLKFFHFHDGEGFRLTLGIYRAIKPLMRGTDFREENCIDLHRTKYAKYMLSPSFKPRGYQDEFLEFLETDTDTTNKLGGLPTGTGKAQPVDMMIPSPKGEPVRFGSLKIGDKVFGSDGKPTVVTGTFPQGIIPSYYIKFTDNTGTYACGEHLWSVKDNDSLADPEMILDTQTLILGIQESSLSIPKATGECIYESRLQKPRLSPYFVGFIVTHFDLINNDLVSTRMTRATLQTLMDHAPEDFMISVTHKSINPISVRLDPSIRWMLLKEGVKIDSYGVKLPKRYKYSTVSDRHELARGMSEGGDYGTVRIESPTLRLDWIELMGGLTGVTMSRQSGLPVDLQGGYFRRTIKSIEKVNDLKCMCISVEAENSLYQCNNHIVTHNTVSAFFYMVKLECVTMIVLRPFLMQQWKNEAKMILGLHDRDIKTVSGGKAFREVLDQAIAGKPKHKVYIVSNKTYYFYLKSFYVTTRTIKCADIKAYERNAESNLRRKMADLKRKDRDVYDQIKMKMGRQELLEKEKDYATEYAHMPPEKFLPALGVGLTIVDEAHLDAHFNNTFYSTMGDIDHHLSLTATYFASDPVITFVFATTFAHDCIYDFLKMRKYIEYYQIKYYHSVRPNPFQYTNAGMYSHNKYCVQKLVKPTKADPGKFIVNPSYVEMIKDILDTKHFWDGYLLGDKVIIFVASLNLAVGLSTTLKDLYPDKTVIKYTGEEKNVNILITADITVLTVGKGAVGLDIRGLTTVINCISIAALALNVQILGRARYSTYSKKKAEKIPMSILEYWNKLPEDDDDDYEQPVRFIQLFCDSLPPQAKHRTARHPYLDERTKFMKMIGNRTYRVTP